MFPEPEITTLNVDHGKRQSGALKYHLGISNVLVFLVSLAELLIKMVNSIVVFFLSLSTNNLRFLTHFSELRGTVLTAEFRRKRK